MVKNKESTDIHCNKCDKVLGIGYYYNPDVKYICSECSGIKGENNGR